MDVQRIDKYVGYHFTDKVGDKICVREIIKKPIYCEDWDIENFRTYFDLQYLEERIDLQETLIYDYADYLSIVNQGMAFHLTERSEVVDQYIYDICGKSFKSPINGEEVNMAEMCYELQPDIYYDIAMTILASRLEDAIGELEEGFGLVIGNFRFYMKEKEED